MLREVAKLRNLPHSRSVPVRRLLLAASLTLATVATGSAFAQVSPAAAANTNRVSPAANDAVQVVDAFMAALVRGELNVARQFMAADAVVIANGHVLGERDDYIDGAAKADAAALRTVHRELLRRNARAGADLAWVLSEKRVRAAATTQGPSEVVVETMLLAKTTAGWKITQIHWSGRHG